MVVNITWHHIHVLIHLSCQLFGQRVTVLSFIHLFPKCHLLLWHSRSIYMLQTCLRGTSEDDSLMSLVTTNLAVWVWKGAARVYFPPKNQHIWSWVGGRTNFQSEFWSLQRVTVVRGCTRSLTPIFTGAFANLKLATEVVLLLDAHIQQLFTGTLMNLASWRWIWFAREKKHSKKWTETHNIKAGGPDTVSSTTFPFTCRECFVCFHAVLFLNNWMYYQANTKAWISLYFFFFFYNNLI